jgi:uncharacterized repeat protein (TIGR03803 family)
MSNRKYAAIGTFVTVILTAALVFPRGAWGQTFKILHSFGGAGDGVNPHAGQVFDAQGNLYGVTDEGPAGPDCFDYGCGVVYQLKPNSNGGWTETVIHAFNGNDGAFPSSSPVFDPQGSLYGSTYCDADYCYHAGFVYELAPNPDGTWTESVLHKFSAPWDGGEPQELVLNNAGDLYGDAYSGGLNNTGTVFSLNRASGWQERLLHSFGQLNGSDGTNPTGASALDADGNFYGTTQAGGAYNSGVVFKLTKMAGLFWQETLLYEFTGHADGNFPNGVIFGPDGSLYGTTQAGGYLGTGVCGFSRGCGTVFKLTSNPDGTWTETVLYAFQGAADGSTPLREITFDKAGNLYGTTSGGGGRSSACSIYGCGTVFELIPSSEGQWTKKTLHSFTGGSDGWGPFSTLVVDNAGSIYGTTELGGLYNGGVAWEITP